MLRGIKKHKRRRSHWPAFITKRHVIFSTLSFLGIIILLQLAYPPGRGLPFASADGTPLQLADHDTMAKVITEKFDATKVTPTLSDDKTVEFSLKSAGAEPNTEQMIKRLSDYPLWLRLVPGSLLWQSVRLSEADVYFTRQPFEVFIKAKSKEFTFPPQNARLSIEHGRVVATEAIQGSEVKSEELLQVMSRAKITLGDNTKVDVPAKRIPAARSSADLAKVRRQAENMLAHTIGIQADTTIITPTKNDMASWIVLSTNAQGDVALTIDREKIKTYINELNKKVGMAAGQTNIEIVDGREMGRSTGAVGRALDGEDLANQLIGALNGNPGRVTVTGKFVTVQPSVIFNSKYTTTQNGLQAYLDDVARTRNMRIMIHQLDGAGWVAASRENESIPSGSTYKLFVALVLFDRINKGEIHWEDPMLDTTVAGCFDRMTVASTNPCAEAWIAQFGRQYIDDFVHARGFSGGTTFLASDANRSTAADLTKYMAGLNDSSLVGGANRDRLLNNLARHPYRYGIPTGSQGQVNDKVGFLWDYIHDTAIIRHPRGTYLMTIMTKGQSYAAIASVTRQVERIMYP